MALKATIKGIPILAIGYNYSRSKTLFFAAPPEAGGLSTGEPYLSRFSCDSFGNQDIRPVYRPLTVSRYFAVNGVIDRHNNLRFDYNYILLPPKLDAP